MNIWIYVFHISGGLQKSSNCNAPLGKVGSGDTYSPSGKALTDISEFKAIPNQSW